MPLVQTHFKEKTPRDKKYLKWLTTRPCELRTSTGFWGTCKGDVVGHHTETGGMSLKGSDYSAISVCFAHHKLFDNATKKGYGILTDETLARIIERNLREYRRLKG